MTSATQGFPIEGRLRGGWSLLVRERRLCVVRGTPDVPIEWDGARLYETGAGHYPLDARGQSLSPLWRPPD